MARWWRPVLLVTLVAAGSAVLLVTGWPTVESVRATTAAAGWAAPVLFTLLFVGFTLVPAPATVMGIAAGVLFGLPVGLATTMTAVAVGSLIGFVLSRTLGREVVAGDGGGDVPGEPSVLMDGIVDGAYEAAVGIQDTMTNFAMSLREDTMTDFAMSLRKDTMTNFAMFLLL